jgi:hypothetical protein
MRCIQCTSFAKRKCLRWNSPCTITIRPMDAEIALSVLSSLCLVGTVILLTRLRRKKLVYLLDYQAGLLFQEGTSARILSPGGHLAGVTQAPINVIDLRSNLFLLERINFRDRQQANCVLSVAGELLVSDPSLALSSLKNLVDDSLTIVRDSMRVAISRSIVDASREGRVKLADAVLSEVNRQLEMRGVKIQNLELTELWAQPMQYSVPAGLN